MNKKNQKRLLKDVLEIIKNPLDKDGIFYKHNENNMLQGYAMIIGPDDTIYRHGFYFFKFHYPKDYPFSPPKVTFQTNNNNVRFHPNLYRSGKVCLSLLNTWRGEQWTSCQTIKTILLTLITLLHNKPLLNEPGIKETYKYFNVYNKIIQWANIKIAIYDILNKSICKDYIKIFENDITEVLKKNKNKIEEYLIIMNASNDGKDEDINFRIPLYSMDVNINYKKLCHLLIPLIKC